jgi:RNA polymerase sigma-70 factor (ECF subfamily)
MGQAHNDAVATGAVPVAGAAPTDEQIVDRVRAGDTAAFELLMRRHNQRLYRTVRSILRDDAETEDTLQESYMSAFTHLDQFRGQARFSTWLTRIAVHEAFHRRKRNARVTDLDDVVSTLASPAGRRAARPTASCGGCSRCRSIACRTTSAPSALRDVEGLSTEAAESPRSRGDREDAPHRARRQPQQHQPAMENRAQASPSASSGATASRGGDGTDWQRRRR